MTMRQAHSVRATHGRSRATRVIDLHTERVASPPRIDRRARSAPPIHHDRPRPDLTLVGPTPAAAQGPSVARAVGRTIVLVALAVLAITVVLPAMLALAAGTLR